MDWAVAVDGLHSVKSKKEMPGRCSRYFCVNWRPVLPPKRSPWLRQHRLWLCRFGQVPCRSAPCGLLQPQHHRSPAGPVRGGTGFGLRCLRSGRPPPEAWCIGVRRPVTLCLSPPGHSGWYSGRALSGRQGEQVHPGGDLSPRVNPGRRIAHDPCGKPNQGVQNRLPGGRGAGRLWRWRKVPSAVW